MTPADIYGELSDIEHDLLMRPAMSGKQMDRVAKLLAAVGHVGDEPFLIDLICDLIQYRSFVWSDRSYYPTDKALPGQENTEAQTDA